MRKKILLLGTVMTLTAFCLAGCGANNSVTDQATASPAAEDDMDRTNEPAVTPNGDDSAVDDLGDGVEDAVDDAGNAVNDVIDGTEDAVDDVGDALDGDDNTNNTDNKNQTNNKNTNSNQKKNNNKNTTKKR